MWIIRIREFLYSQLEVRSSLSRLQDPIAHRHIIHTRPSRLLSETDTERNRKSLYNNRPFVARKRIDRYAYMVGSWKVKQPLTFRSESPVTWTRGYIMWRWLNIRLKTLIKGLRVERIGFFSSANSLNNYIWKKNLYAIKVWFVKARFNIW